MAAVDAVVGGITLAIVAVDNSAGVAMGPAMENTGKVERDASGGSTPKPKHDYSRDNDHSFINV